MILNDSKISVMSESFVLELVHIIFGRVLPQSQKDKAFGFEHKLYAPKDKLHEILSSPLDNLLTVLYALSLFPFLSAFPCFSCHACQQSCTLSEVREGSSHIFHPLSVSDSMSALVGETRAGREEKREGWRAGVWMGAGTVEKSRCRDEKKARPKKVEKKAFC